MGMIQHLKTLHKKAEYYLYNYKSLKEELEQAKEDIYLGKKSVIPEYSPHDGYVSNPTEKAVLLYERKYGKVEEWIKCIDKAFQIVEDENFMKKKLAEMRFFEGKKIEQIAEALDIDTTTCWRWKDEFVNLVIMLAIEKNLLRVA